MIQLKSLSPEAIPAALVKAKQYRLLNEPNEAESICLDILETDPDHQEALSTLLLALTDKFGESGLTPAFEQAKGIVTRLDDSRSKHYYEGIIFERRGKFHLRQGGPGSGGVAYEWLTRAMESFDMALAESSRENQDTILRWNSCARIMNEHPDVRPFEPERAEMFMDAYDTPH
jgi:hypothetical protein